MATLYIVATPIGNLSDVSDRTRAILSSVDLVLCEDTRVTKKLLNAYEITTAVQSLHQHSTSAKHSALIKKLVEGKDLAMVTDAGTPGISDPGGKFIADALEEIPDLNVSPIPGPSAVIAALSISGFPTDHFTFLGFPPHKKGRVSFFKELDEIEHTVAFYESTHRIEKAMDALEEVIPDRKIMVARELTKMYETVYRGTPSEVKEKMSSGSLKGEFVIVLAPKKFS